MKKLDSLLIALALAICFTQLQAMSASPAASKSAAKSDAATKTSLTVTSDAGTSTTVKQGQDAVVVVKTNPNAKGTIEVKLKSGVSRNAALKPQQAGADGLIKWTWTVAKNTAAGPIDWTVVVKERNRKAETHGTIQVEKAGK